MAKTKKKQEQAEVPGWMRVLVDYLLCYTPADAPGPGVDLKTTDEIVNELSPMADMAANPAADVIASLGFRSYHSPEGVHGWMLRRGE